MEFKKTLPTSNLKYKTVFARFEAAIVLKFLLTDKAKNYLTFKYVNFFMYRIFILFTIFLSLGSFFFK